MSKYRKKPLVIEATQWFKNGDHPADYTLDHQGLETVNGAQDLRTFTAAERKENGWEGDVVRYFRRPDVPGGQPCKHCASTMHHHGWIDTLEGGHIVCPGDFVITGVAGERYPCKPDIFAATYEAVAMTGPTTPQSALTASALDDLERLAKQAKAGCIALASAYEDGGRDFIVGDLSTILALVAAAREARLWREYYNSVLGDAEAAELLHQLERGEHTK